MEYLRIVLRSDLCAGNGESVGNDIDTDVCMDTAGLPYIPSRRLKGCLKQAAFDMKEMEYPDAEDKIRRLFGDAYGNEGCLFLQDAVMKGADAIREFLTEKIPADCSGTQEDKGRIPDAVKRMAHVANVQRMFSKVRGQTRLVDGVKADNSLRFTRVISHYDPFDMANQREMEFYAPFYLDTENLELRGFLKDCCKATRHIGTSRNRGLGNVTISVWRAEEELDEKQVYEMPEAFEKTLCLLQPEDKVKISYHISLDAPVTLPGCGEMNTSIPARSVIGCLSAYYLRTGTAEDAMFCSLFQNGEVRWSALTPVIEGRISDPAPAMLVKLKNDRGRLLNHLTETNVEWKGLKPKTLDGAFASFCASDEGGKTGYTVAEPLLHTVYHHAVNGTVQDRGSFPASSAEEGRGLYMQDSVDAGMIYGGTVICAANMAAEVIGCLCGAKLRFGRSRSAQYAACSLREIANLEPCNEKMKETEKGETVYVILKSDLILQKEGRFVTSEEEVRGILADRMGFTDRLPEGKQDYCRYHTIGGYQSAWKLQKPHVPAVRAGSVYCFEATGEKVPSVIQIGSFPQEGFGVCYVMTDSQMRQAVLVSEGRIDRVEPQKNEEYIRTVYSRLLVSAGLEKMREYALDYHVKGDRIPVARLRRMLSEAKEYKDFLRMIGTIKESDVSSENESGRKKDSEELVRRIYEETEKDAVSLEKILGKDKDLYAEINTCQEAKEALLGNWKLPLEIILHRQHYMKER